jgi:TetR/AcrR family transcriptional regulator
MSGRGQTSARARNPGFSHIPNTQRVLLAWHYYRAEISPLGLIIFLYWANYLVSMKPVSPDLPLESSSKERILNASQAIFAQKGFEGARVDEIARAAGVNKALIYYYFKSKEEILHALLHHAIEDLLGHLGNPARVTIECLSSDALLHEYLASFLEFLEERRDLFTIVVTELLKDSERRTLVLGHLGEELQFQHGAFVQMGVGIDSRENLVTEFFTGFVPLLMFVLLREPWQKLYAQDEAELRSMFIKAFEATHVRYTFELLKSAQANGGKEGAGE